MNFALVIAESCGTYDTEYDGRSYTYCFFCDACMSEGEKHRNNCAYIHSLKSKAWQNKLKIIAEKKAIEYRKSPEYMREKVPCRFCGKKITRLGLRNHQKDTGCKQKVCVKEYNAALDKD